MGMRKSYVKKQSQKMVIVTVAVSILFVVFFCSVSRDPVI